MWQLDLTQSVSENLREIASGLPDVAQGRQPEKDCADTTTDSDASVF